MAKTKMITISEYQQFCWEKLKPEIANGETSSRLMYFSSKLLSEVLELEEVWGDACETSRFLEAGDVLFYLGLLAREYEVNLSIIRKAYERSYYPAFIPFDRQLIAEAGRLNDLLIKHHFHGKPADRNLVVFMISNLYRIYISLCSAYQESSSIRENIHKLNARHGPTYNAEYYKN